MRTTTCAPVGFGSGTSTSSIASGPPNSLGPARPPAASLPRRRILLRESLSWLLPFPRAPPDRAKYLTRNLNLHERRGRLTRQHSVNIIQREHAHGGVRFQSRAADMRQQESIPEPRIFGTDVGLTLENIQSRSGNMARLQRRDQSAIVHKSAARRVDHNRPRRQQRNILRVQKMLRLWRTRRVQAEELADAQQILRAFMKHGVPGHVRRQRIAI